MDKYINNANYYLLQAKNEDNDLLFRKECCDLANKYFKKIQNPDKLTEIKYVYMELGQLFYCHAVKLMDEVFSDESLNPNKLGDKSLQNLDLAISNFKNSKQCGNDNCNEMLNECLKKKKQLNIMKNSVMTF